MTDTIEPSPTHITLTNLVTTQVFTFSAPIPPNVDGTNRKIMPHVTIDSIGNIIFYSRYGKLTKLSKEGIPLWTTSLTFSLDGFTRYNIPFKRLHVDLQGNSYLYNGARCLVKIDVDGQLVYSYCESGPGRPPMVSPHGDVLWMSNTGTSMRKLVDPTPKHDINENTRRSNTDPVRLADSNIMWLGYFLAGLVITSVLGIIWKSITEKSIRLP